MHSGTIDEDNLQLRELRGGLEKFHSTRKTSLTRLLDQFGFNFGWIIVELKINTEYSLKTGLYMCGLNKGVAFISGCSLRDVLLFILKVLKVHLKLIVQNEV